MSQSYVYIDASNKRISGLFFFNTPKFVCMHAF